jgi:peptidoglycan-associated lipoprotein
LGKFAALALAMAVAVGCSSKGGDNAGEGAAVDPNAGYGANTGAVDGSLSEEAALRAITTFYFEYEKTAHKMWIRRTLLK